MRGCYRAKGGDRYLSKPDCPSSFKNQFLEWNVTFVPNIFTLCSILFCEAVCRCLYSTEDYWSFIYFSPGFLVLMEWLSNDKSGCKKGRLMKWETDRTIFPALFFDLHFYRAMTFLKSKISEMQMSIMRKSVMDMESLKESWKPRQIVCAKIELNL